MHSRRETCEFLQAVIFHKITKRGRSKVSAPDLNSRFPRFAEFDLAQIIVRPQTVALDNASPFRHVNHALEGRQAARQHLFLEVDKSLNRGHTQ